MKELSVQVIDQISLDTIANVHVVACAELDATCSQKIAEGTTGANGVASLRVPADFKGYLQQTERSDFTPTIYMLPTVFPGDGMLPAFPLLASGAIARALVTALGKEPDPTRGWINVFSKDCFGAGVAGVAFSSPQFDASAVQFYIADMLPANVNVAKSTEANGAGGYVNFPVGMAVVTAKTAQSGLDLGSARILVRAGYASVAYIRPPNR